MSVEAGVISEFTFSRVDRAFVTALSTLTIDFKKMLQHVLYTWSPASLFRIIDDEGVIKELRYPVSRALGN